MPAAADLPTWRRENGWRSKMRWGKGLPSDFMGMWQEPLPNRQVRQEYLKNRTQNCPKFDGNPKTTHPKGQNSKAKGRGETTSVSETVWTNFSVLENAAPRNWLEKQKHYIYRRTYMCFRWNRWELSKGENNTNNRHVGFITHERSGKERWRGGGAGYTTLRVSLEVKSWRLQSVLRRNMCFSNG